MRATMLLPMMLALATPALAGTEDARDFARKGDFAIQQIATGDPAALLQGWARPAAMSTPPVVDGLARGQVVDSFIVFTGCRPDLFRNCNVTADFTLIGPQGQVFAEDRDAAVWVGKRAPGFAQLTLSDSSLALYVEPGDPAGAYTLRAAVTDHNARVTLVTEKVLTVTSGERAD